MGKSVDMGNLPFYLGLAVIALAAYAVWSTLHIQSNSQYTLLGKSVDCVKRPNWEAVQRCNAARESVACMHETKTKLADWYSDIDRACAQFEPQRQFRFPAYYEPETLEVAEVSG